MLLPSSNERVVGRIFRLLCVAEDEPCQPVAVVQACLDKLLERGSPCSLGIRRQCPTGVAQLTLSNGDRHLYRRTRRLKHSSVIVGCASVRDRPALAADQDRGRRSGEAVRRDHRESTGHQPPDVRYTLRTPTATLDPT